MQKNVKMEARITFAGDREEGLHPRGSYFWTTESRALKYAEGGLAVRLEERVEETVSVQTPHKPQEFKRSAVTRPARAVTTQKKAKRQAPSSSGSKRSRRK